MLPRCLAALALGSSGFHSDLILTWASTVRTPLPTLIRFLTIFLAKHFLNDPSSLVIESLQGLCTINPKLGLDANNKGFTLGRVVFPMS